MKKISTTAPSTSRIHVAEEDTSPRPNNRTRSLDEVSQNAPRADQALRNALPRRPAQTDPDVQQAAETLWAMHHSGTKS
ncbi:hypothetical protein GO998_23275 (plasmid) [Ralstonia syzygii]|uniref:Type III effector protein n=1 Tax=Ralstonia syzygii TaxID=28097 RepID=A0ABX7ZMJ3_9RALS|nr:hypothetical protein [Ralstonia syzygii]QUP56581.1 hypothetical protein GO998_23275 [Ralstonia syzygii]